MMHDSSAPAARRTERGFLPPVDPARALPKGFEAWEQLAAELPSLLAAGRARRAIEALPLLDTQGLDRRADLERAMLLLSFFGHAMIHEHWWEGRGRRVPRSVAVPWHAVAQRLGRPPVLSYASHGAQNWRRLDPNGGLEIENLTPLVMFLGGLDEIWFIAVHMSIEAAAIPAVQAVMTARQLAAEGRAAELIEQFAILQRGQYAMYDRLIRLREKCDPYIFYNRIQPFLHGFRESPVTYEGVAEWEGQPQALVGASAAQSPVLAFFDGALGIVHENDHLAEYLRELRRYMPVEHRALLSEVEAGPSLRDVVLAQRGISGLVDAYNACITALDRFRSKHLEVTATYIVAQAGAKGVGAEQGTGGTPFMRYLKKLRDDTQRHLSA